MTACVLPKCPVKGYFSCDKVRPEKCKKRGVFDFSPGDFSQKGVFFCFFLSSLWTPEKLFRIYGGTLSIFPDLGGSLRQEKPVKSPRKGGSKMLAVLR